jgi:hypothetical protein
MYRHILTDDSDGHAGRRRPDPPARSTADEVCQN